MTQQATRSGLREGDIAPDFVLTGTSRRAGEVRERPKSQYQVRDYRGQPVLLLFFSAAFTPT
jgi:peroxiredoxin